MSDFGQQSKSFLSFLNEFYLRNFGATFHCIYVEFEGTPPPLF